MSNNPYHRDAGFYELNLSLPVISAIRRQEARIVLESLAGYADAAERVLEVGPGTGFYTLPLSRMFREVVAVEDSARMAEVLRERVRAAGAANVTVVNGDFLAREEDGRYEVAVAIGVLDYIGDPAAFVTKLCACARRAVVLTVPQQGLWGRCFVAANRLRGTAVYCYRAGALNDWAPGWRCTTKEVGLRTPLTRGLTLVAALERV